VPELPEVEVVRRGLERWVAGRRVTDVEVLHPRAIRRHLPGAADFATRLAGRRILAAAEQASAVITVSQPLKDRLVALGVDAGKVSVLRNGVDVAVFRAEAREAARAALGLPRAGAIAACVGNLVPEKGQGLAIDALRRLPGLRLVIVGDGPLRRELAAQAEQHGLTARVEFRAVIPQHELSRLYAAADVLLLTSQREGWPNVVLEAMACGTPVVATRVGGIPEVLPDHAGILVNAHDRIGLEGALIDALGKSWDTDAIARGAGRFRWDENIRRLSDVLEAAAMSRAGQVKYSAS